MKKRLLALLMAAAMMMATAACGSETTTAENNTTSTTEQTTEEGGSGEAASTEESTSTESNDTFTVAISYMPDSLSPQTGGSDDYTSMTRPLFDRLFLENIEGGLDYYLADSLEVSEDGLQRAGIIHDRRLYYLAPRAVQGDEVKNAPPVI